LNLDILKSEVVYKAVRSSKPGGQHVNKVSTKIQISIDLTKSKAFTQEELDIIHHKLKNRIAKSGLLSLSAETSRSQYTNKKSAWDLLVFLLQKTLKQTKKRLKTKPKKSAVLKRLQKKKRHALKKELRKKIR